MRYDYECTSCQQRQEVHCSMSDRKDVLPCPECGGTAEQIIPRVPQAFVRFREHTFDRSKNVRSNGRLFGRSDREQHEHYRRSFDLQKKLVKAQRRSGKLHKEDECQYLGGMPGEMADSIGEAEGDPEVVNKDPETWLKKTGLHMGRD